MFFSISCLVRHVSRKVFRFSMHVNTCSYLTCDGLLAYNIRPAKHLVLELFGPVAPDTFRRWHDGGAPDHRGRPPAELPPFALSRLANLTRAVAARLSLSVHTWQHVYRRMLRELDIEFEPSSQLTRKFLRWTERTCETLRTCSAATWPNTLSSSSWKPIPTSNVSIWTPAHWCSGSCCSHSCTQQHRTQTARNIELLAGASSIGTRWSSVSFSQRQNVFWRRENCFHEAQPRSHAPDAEAEATDSEPEVHVLEPLADDHNSDGEDTATHVEESAVTAAPAIAAAPKRAATSLLERLQRIRIIHGNKTTNVTAPCLCVAHKKKAVVHNPEQREPGYQLGVASARVRVRVNRSISTPVGSERVVVCCCFFVHPFLPLFPCVFTFFASSSACNSEWGQMTTATAINAVPVLEEVYAGITKSGACGSICLNTGKTHQVLTHNKN